MTPEYKTALIRAAIAGLILGAANFFQVAPLVGPSVAAYSAGGIFCATMAVRFLGEGTIDSKRANPPTA